ncbi:MAG: LysE family translocator [Alphaproteobacteria bacterium]
MTALNTDLFIAFCLATTALVLLPGPIVTLVIANAIAHGRRTGLATVAGASTGNALLVAAGALGLSTLLALLADIFEYVRWVGVAYLIYLGLRQWREVVRASTTPGAIAIPRGRSVFGQAFVVAITNPKTILFYAAFFPQFVDRDLAIAPQLVAMSVAFVVIGIVFDSTYALLAARIRPLLMGERRTRIRNGLTGSLLIGTGIGLALARRGS